MTNKFVVFTITAVGNDFFNVETTVPGVRFDWPLRTLKLALEYPHWHARESGAPVLIEVRDQDGELVNTFRTDDLAEFP